MNTDQTNQPQGEQTPLCRAITLLEQSAAPFDEACRILREEASGEAGMLVKLVPVRTLQDSINEWDELIASTDINAPVPAKEEAPAARGLPPEPGDRELLPCPFCGNAEELMILPNGIGDYFVQCGDIDSGCGARTSDVHCESKWHAIQRWNARAQARTSPGEDVVRELVDAADKACGELAERVAVDMDHRQLDHSKWYKAVARCWKAVEKVRAAQNAGEGRKP